VSSSLGGEVHLGVKLHVMEFISASGLHPILEYRVKHFIHGPIELLLVFLRSRVILRVGIGLRVHFHHVLHLIEHVLHAVPATVGTMTIVVYFVDIALGNKVVILDGTIKVGEGLELTRHLIFLCLEHVIVLFLLVVQSHLNLWVLVVG